MLSILWRNSDLLKSRSFLFIRPQAAPNSRCYHRSGVAAFSALLCVSVLELSLIYFCQTMMHWELVFVMTKRITGPGDVCVCVWQLQRRPELSEQALFNMSNDPPWTEQELLCLVFFCVFFLRALPKWTHRHGNWDMWCMAGGYQPRFVILVSSSSLCMCINLHIFTLYGDETFKAFNL